MLREDGLDRAAGVGWPDGTAIALLVTLEPGLYTAQVSGVSATTGLGLVELYEMP